MKKILKIAIILLALVSCSSEDNINEDNSPKLLQRMDQLFEGNEITPHANTMEYKYDEDYKLVSFDTGYHFFNQDNNIVSEFVYTNDKITSIIKKQNGELFYTEEFEFVEEKVVKKSLVYNNSSYRVVYEYSYEEDTLVSLKETQIEDGIVNENIYTYEYFDTYIKMNIGKTFHSYTNFVFDNRQSNISDSALYNLDPLNSFGNIIQQNEYSEDGTLIFSTNATNIYDEDGFITKSFIVWNNYGTIWEETRTYTYNK